ncbi:hypothetical protein [Paenibacillus donghaensis]|uniref:Uncharacterized protein n=1 Tax=Paenibacillus donghaensis TaxID=414771 RepID=A0A2Z2KNF1_9BACL|nr:hypothetical protein [Paenibacillus donghaensis]ASA22722.1 hypothetical protein B9T62_19135 [Paenibacillus donghaensis]
MSKKEFDFENENLKLKEKAYFYTSKIWNEKFTGKIEYANNFRGTHGALNFWTNEDSTIQINKKLSSPRLEFNLDDTLIYLLTQWYCRCNNLNRKNEFLLELESHGICSKDKFSIHNNVAYTGSINKREWEPTIKLIELNIEFSTQ